MKTKEERAKGRKELHDYAAGKRLTPIKSIYAKCYECSGGIAEEIKNCTIASCPLFPHNPYNRQPKVQFKRNASALAKARQKKKGKENVTAKPGKQPRP